MEPTLAAWLSKNHGVVSRTWLTQAGFSAGRIRSLLDSGTLIAIQRGVYIATSSPRSERQRLMILCMKYSAVASHTSAGRAWGFRRLGKPTGIHVTLPHRKRAFVRPLPGDPDGLGPGLPGDHDVTVHRTSNLMKSDVVTSHDGVLVTSAARTVFDLAAILPAANLESIIEQALASELLTVEDLIRIGQRISHRGRAGSARFNAVLGSRPADQPPVDSDYELRFAHAWTNAGLPPLDRQRPLLLPSGIILHPDFAEPRRRFLIEVDHATWHGGHRENMRDRWRDRQYHLLGWRSERVADEDITHRLPQTIAELATIYHAIPDPPDPPNPPNPRPDRPDPPHLTDPPDPPDPKSGSPLP